MKKITDNRLEMDLWRDIRRYPLTKIMKMYEGRYFYELQKPYGGLDLLKIQKRKINEIGLWSTQEGLKLRLGGSNPEGSTSSNNVEHGQFFWTFEEAVAAMKVRI